MEELKELQFDKAKLDLILQQIKDSKQLMTETDFTSLSNLSP